MLSDPDRISVQCRLAPRCCLPPLEQRRLLHCTLSGLNHTACRLPVYASQDELPHHHATLGSGCRHAWPGWIVYLPGPYERFPDRLLLSSFLRLCLAHSTIELSPQTQRPQRSIAAAKSLSLTEHTEFAERTAFLFGEGSSPNKKPGAGFSSESSAHSSEAGERSF